MKVKTATAIFLATVFTSAQAQAETYNTEAGIQYGTYKADDSTNQKTTRVGGTYYFNPVTLDRNSPFAELAFLQKASNATLAYTSMSYEDATFSNTKIPEIDVAGKFYIDDFAVSVSKQSWNKRLSYKTNATQSYGLKSDVLGFQIGYFALPKTLISFETETQKVKYDPSTGLATQNDLSRKSNGLNSHSVISLGNEQSIVLDLAYRQIKSDQTQSLKNNEQEVSVRYYPVSRYYLQGGLTTNHGDDGYYAGNTIGIGAGYSFTPRLGLLISTQKFTVSDSNKGADNKVKMMSIGYRF